MKKCGRFEGVFGAVALIFIAIVIAMMWVFLYGQFAQGNYVRIPDDCSIYAEPWYWEHDGVTESFTMPFNLDVEDGEPVTISTVLPEYIEDGAYLYYYSGRDCTIYIDGRCILNYNHKMNFLPGRNVKSIWWPIQMSSAYRGKTLTIYRFEDKACNGTNNAMYYGRADSIRTEIFKKCGVPFVFALILAFLSLIVIVVGFILRYFFNNSLPIIYLGYGMLMSALWFIFDSDLYQLIFGRCYVDGIMSYLLTLTMLFPFLRFLNEVQEHRHEKVITALAIVMLINAVTWITLHFTDVICLDSALTYIDVVIGVIILGTLALIFSDIYSGEVAKYRFVAIGMGGLAVAAIAEIILINAISYRFDGTCFLLGMYFLLTMAIVHSANMLLQMEKEKMEALNASNMKSSFLANMSHEIRTPINSIIGMNEMILREGTDPTIAEYSGYIKRSSKVLLGLVNDVLDFSKIESGNIDIDCEPYKTSGMIADMVEILKERAGHKGLEAKILVDTKIPAVLDGDEIHIRQIVMNLITNAVKYTLSGEISLKVTFERNEGERFCNFIFEVSDTGIGIKEENIDAIFDSFTRVDLNQTRTIEGTGLGLAIVKQLLERMDGTIDVDSVYGAGTTFRVSIPQLIVAESVIGEEWDKSIKESSNEDNYMASFIAPEGKILVVDDNQSNLVIIKQLLKGTMVHVDMCMGGEQALELLGREKYDLVFLDHMMPVMDGVETFRRLRAKSDGINADTPVIVLTANAIAGSKEEYLREGFTNYLSKPVDAMLLEQMVEMYLPAEKKKKGGKQITGNKATADDIADITAKNAADTNTKEDSTVVDGGTAMTTLRDIEGLDYDSMFIAFGSSNDFIEEIVGKVANETLERLAKLKEEFASEDYANYTIDAHGIKGMMASIYYEPLRAHAKEHEFAAKEGRYDYIKEDIDSFVSECTQFCNLVKKILNC